MEYREVGRTGVKVSEIGFGGEWASPSDPAHAAQMVDRCEQAGINLLDCWMADPGIRSNLGDALQGRRGQWRIQGHLGSTWQDGQYTRTRDIDAVKAAFEDLLERFHTDYMDFGMLHFVDDRDDYDTVMNGEVLEYAKRLLADGTIRHLGMSTHNPAIAQMAAESGEVEMIMFSVNPAFDLMPSGVKIEDLFTGDVFSNEELAGISPDRVKLYRTCEERGIGLTVMKAFAGGRLLDEADSPFGVAFTPVQCLHYALTRPAVASVLAGFRDAGQIDASVAYETADAAARDYASVLAKAPHHAFAGQCTYCGHCAPCPVGIDVAYVNKYADLASAHDEVPASVADHYAQLAAHAGDCIACGQCEERCPFGVGVIEKMGKAAQLFGK